MRIPFPLLQDFVHQIFLAAGCGAEEAACTSQHLVEANLVGHDSHGVIRTASYVSWLKAGKVRAGRVLRVVRDAGGLVVADGELGLGQWIGRQAVALGIERAGVHGISAVALRNAGHLGRIGHWAEQAAAAGLISLHFVNTTGLGLLVAPYGGIDRRLSANPLAIGFPRGPALPLILDISTSMIAEGKIRVARNKGVPVPAGCIIDSQGQPSCDAVAFYGDPPGAILPFGGHKGYGLGLLTELLAGAVTGGGCSKEGEDRLRQGMLSIYLQPEHFTDQAELFPEVERFVSFVRTSRLQQPDGEILLPGELEARLRRQRQASGVDLDEATWEQVLQTAHELDVPPPALDRQP